MRTAKAAVYEAPNTPFIMKDFPLRPVQPRRSSGAGDDVDDLPLGYPFLRGPPAQSRAREFSAMRSSASSRRSATTSNRICAAIRSRSAIASPGASISSTASATTAKCWTCRRSATACANTATISSEEDPHFLGGFAEYCYILPGTWILKLPDELSDEEATPLNCGVATMASVTEAAEIALGDTVVIQGLGLLGLYGAAMAKARGARCVIGLDAVESRLVTAKKFGCDHVINIGKVPEKEVIARVRDLCRPDGADAVIEVCGVPEVINQGLQMLRVGGRYVLGGLVNPGANVTIDANMLVKRWVTMRGIHNYHPRHLIQALDFVMSNRNRFPFKDIVDSKFALKDLDSAFKKASERTVLRAAIVPGYKG